MTLRVVRTLAVTLAVTVAGLQAWLLLGSLPPYTLGDLEIYHGAIEYALSGRSLYDYVYDHPTVPGFGFTYPPFAAVVLRPLTWVPLVAAKVTWTLVTMALVVALVTFLVRHARTRDGSWLDAESPHEAVVTAVALGTVVLLLSQPLLHHLAVGQISLWITAAALLGAMGTRTRPWLAALTGLATAVKLTPLVFVPHWVVTRQWRVLGVALATAAAATAVGFVIHPADSVRYAQGAASLTDRVGDPALNRNKSILGLLTRWGLADDTRSWVWLAACVVVGGFALWAAARHHVRGELLEAALVIGALSLAISPISWPHHQGWMVLVALWLLLRRPWWARVAGGMVAASFALGSPFWSLGEEGGWWLRVGWEVPTLLIVAVSVLGLPRQGAVSST